jgi:hypothetical protein
MTRFRFLAATAALSLALGALTAPTASAAGLTGRTWVGTPNGLVGVQQTVIVRAPRLAGQPTTITFSNPSTGSNAGQAVVNSAGFAYLPWTPNLPGTWTVTATSGTTTLDTATVSVTAMPTTTTLLVAGEVQQNQSATLIAQVEAIAGSITPSGTITVRNQSSAVVATGTLGPTGTAGLASVNMSWTPSPGAVTLTATYAPATAAFTGSTSVSQAPVVAGAQVVSLRMPPVMYVGVTETLSAVIQPEFQSPTGGSVAFSLNTLGILSYPMGGSRPLSGGVGSTSWVPTQAGPQTVGVAYASGDFSVNGTDTQIVNIQPAPAADSITVTPTGAPAWVPGSVGTLTAGNSVTLAPSSASGNPVTLSVNGPCAMEAGVLTVLSAGTCTVTASSIGNGGSLKAAQAQYTIMVQAAPVKKKKRR